MGKKAKVFRPGDYVFAKVKGYPAWPAKISNLNGKKYNIYFYGTGETANLPANDIFDYFDHKQQFLAKSLKRRDYNEGLAQIESEVTERGITSNAARPDGDDENDTSNVPDTTVEESEAEKSTLGGADTTVESDVPDTPAPAPAPTPTPTPEPVKVPKKRGANASDASATSATPAKTRKVEEPAPEPEPQVSEDAVQTVAQDVPEPEPENDQSVDSETTNRPTENANHENDAAAQVVKTPQTTPVSRGRKPKTPQGAIPANKTPRRAVKQEVMSPVYEPHVPAPESVSRSGRKIKPKRHFEEDATESVPVTPNKKVKTLSSPPAANSNSEDHQPGANHADSDSAIVSPVNDAPKRGRKKMVKQTAKTFHFISKNDLESLQDPSNVESESALSFKEHVLPALLPNGKLIALKLFKDWPESFASPVAQNQWISTTVKNIIRLKQDLESGRIKSESILSQIETELNLSSEESASMKREQENELKKRKLDILKVECKLVELEKGIRSALSFDSADVERCIEYMDELNELNITKLMLLKQPGIVHVVKQVRRYVGNAEQWKLSPEELANFEEKKKDLQKKAQTCFEKFKGYFGIDDDNKFVEMYSHMRIMFMTCTENLSEQDAIELVDEPIELSQPNAFSATVVDEELKKESPNKKSHEALIVSDKESESMAEEKTMS